MLKTCPDPEDVQDIQFKLQCSLKVFDNTELDTFPNNYNLISCASRYGLIFVGSNTTVLKVIQAKSIENFNPKDKNISNFKRRNVPLPSTAQHVCVNCDSTLLAVVVEKDSCPIVIFYDVLSFYARDINIIKEVRLSASPGVFAKEINWNPALPNIFTACKSDGSLGIYEIKDNSVSINELPQASESTSFCWSPKGKQIAVGSRNGNITQYKPDLKAVKVINGPTFERPVSLISLCWISNFQFIGIYQENEGQAKLIVIDAPKTGETSYTNYEDVCYSGLSRKPQFYLILLQHWNMLMIASSNSMELGLLGAISELWTQWNVPDFARAELPLAADKQDTLPVGMALDISNTKPLPWGESTIPPCPYLLLLSHHGILYFFNIVNLKQGMPSICCPTDPISNESGIEQFVGDENKLETSPLQLPQINISFGAPQAQITTQTPKLQTPQPVLPSQPPFNFPKPIPTQPFQSFSVPSTSLFSKTSDTKPLFVEPGTLPSFIPQGPSVSLFGNSSINLTPVSKPQNDAKSSEKYSSIYTALKESSVVPIPETKPIVISNQKVNRESPLNAAPDIAIPETPKNVVSRTNIDPKAVIDEKVKEETDALLVKMIQNECLSLESELKAVFHQGRNININIGTEEEKIHIVTELNNLQEFIKEIVDVSLGESAEVHSLKQNLILSWSWYEEALSRYNMSKDQTMSLLLKSQPLDSAAEKRRSDIKKMIYYLESQFYQASKALDEQWDKFQDYAKKTYKVQMPTMEAIFQSMVQQEAIIQKQSYILKDISSRLKHRKVSSNTPSLFLSNKLEEDLLRLQLEPVNSHQYFYKQSLEQAEKLSFTKRTKLRNLLKIRDISHVTAAKPQLNSSISLLRIPATKNKFIFSILGAQMSPVSKPSVAKNLQFSESTPVKFVQEIKPTAVPPNTPAQPDSSKSFTFKDIEKSSTFIPPTTTFVSTPKSSSFLNQTSNSSAFVPTIPTPKTFLVPQVTATTTSSNLFNLSTAVPKPSPQINFGNNISVTPIVGKKVESVPLTAATTTKVVTSFSNSANLFVAKTDTSTTLTAVNSPQTYKPLFNVSTSTSPSFRTDPGTSLFSFGNTPAVTTTIKMKPAPSSTTSSQLLSTAPLTFSFGNTTSSKLSVADSTIKPLSPDTSVLTNISIKEAISSAPSVLSAPKTSITTTSIASPVQITAQKTLNLGAPLISTTTKTIDFGAPIPSNVCKITTTSVSSFTFSFGDAPTTTSSFFGTVTTTATSLFGSITTPSVTSAISSAKPALSISSDITATTVEASRGISQASPISTSAKSGADSVFSSAIPSTTASKTPFAQSTGSLFSSAITTTSVTSIFGASTTSVSSTKPFFGSSIQSTTSIFATVSNSEPVFSANSTSSSTTISSIFSNTSAKSATSSIFSSTVLPTSPSRLFATVSIASCTSSPVSPNSISQSGNLNVISRSSEFGISTVATDSTSLFSTTPSFGSTTSSSTNIFGNATTTQSSDLNNEVATTQTSIFSTPISTTPTSAFGTTTSGQFGSSTTNVSTSVFGGARTTQTSAFATSIANTSAPVFGNTSTTTQASFFGASPNTVPVFGTTPTTTTQASMFGAASSSSGSLFGSTPTTQPSIFGTTSPSSTQAAPVFGSGVSTNSIFGAPNTSSPFNQTNIFANAVKTTTSGFGSGFSSPSTAPFGGNSGSMFGSTPTTTNNVFGSTGSAFGSVSSSNVFSSGGNSSFSFASGANSGGSLGFGDLNVGSTSASSGSIFGGSTNFGQTPTPANPFTRTNDQKSPFGGTTSTFGSPSSTTGSIFGSNSSSTFGSNAQQNVFGSTSFGSSSGFGQPPAFAQNSSFGGSNSSFGSSQPGPFSGGGVGVGQTGFGSPNFQKPASGFGAAPIFGGSPPQPAFGASPNFGAPPGFGGTPSFGSPSKVFGPTTPASSFGQATVNDTPGFGNLASQNTVGFGSLAQQATTPTSASFSGSSSFSSWR